MSVIIANKLYYTTAEVTKLFRVTDRTLRNWRRLGLRYIKPAGRIYYAAEDIAKFLDDHKHDDTGTH